jgi:hypothetical protein
MTFSKWSRSAARAKLLEKASYLTRKKDCDKQKTKKPGRKLKAETNNFLGLD